MTASPARLFLSQSDRVTARELDRLISSASTGSVALFNTAVEAHGLTPGDYLNHALAGQISESDIFVSAWSPNAVRNPAWMAWELGIAVALAKPTKIIRVLGTRVDSMPLGLASQYSSDIGVLDELVQFCASLNQELPRSEIDLARIRQDFVPKGMTFSPLWSREVDQSIRVSRRGGERILIENLTEARCTDVRAIDLPSPDSEKSPNLVAAINHAFRRHANVLEPFQRIVVAPSEISPARGSEVEAPADDLTLQWFTADTGRAHCKVVVNGAA